MSEETPLGTAGALGLMEAPSEPLLVINGDVLTRVNFRAMLAWHREHRADLTVAVRRFEHAGAVRRRGRGRRKRHAPCAKSPTCISSSTPGIYLLEPSVYQFIEAGTART